MNIITREQALRENKQHYFTGEPCKHGHLSVRTVRDWKCVECVNNRNREQRIKHYDKRREGERNYFDIHREEYRQRSANRYYKNRIATLEKYKEYYYDNKEKCITRCKNYYERNRTRRILQMKDYYVLQKEHTHIVFGKGKLYI